MTGTSGARTNGDLRYAVVARALAAEIRSGELPEAAHLPSERTLVDRFGVSRVTVRRALRALESDGLVVSVAGRGWLVRGGGLEEPQNELLSFTDIARERGLVASSRVLVARVREATLDEADRLGVAPGAPCVELERIRHLDNVPVAIDRSVVPKARAPRLLDVDWAEASLYVALEAAGCPPSRADYVLQAAAADAREASLLGLPVGGPVLRAEQVTYDTAGRPVHLSWMTYRGDRYRFRASLARRG